MVVLLSGGLRWTAKDFGCLALGLQSDGVTYPASRGFRTSLARVPRFPQSFFFKMITQIQTFIVVGLNYLSHNERLGTRI